jgi:hypothetical protein
MKTVKVCNFFTNKDIFTNKKIHCRDWYIFSHLPPKTFNIAHIPILLVVFTLAPKTWASVNHGHYLTF